MQKKTEEEKTYSFRELFTAYSKFGDSNSNGTTIKLVQSDKWMKTAGLFNETFSLTDTLIIFKDFKSENLSYKTYLQFIRDLCNSKKLDYEKVKGKLEKAGLPKRQNTKEIWDFSIVNSNKRKENKKKTKPKTKTDEKKSK